MLFSGKRKSFSSSCRSCNNLTVVFAPRYQLNESFYDDFFIIDYHDSVQNAYPVSISIR